MIEKITRIYNKINWKLVTLIAFCVYMIVTSIMCWNHEMFRDEAQAWLIARDNSIPGIARFAWEEGHPWLWHLILKLANICHYSYETIKYFAFAITGTAVFLLLKKSPFPKIVSILLAFTPPFFYYYSAIGRNYCLLALGCILVATYWKDRYEKPLLMGFSLGILASSHLLGLTPAILLALGFYLPAITIYKWPKGSRNKICLYFGLGIFLLMTVIFVGALYPQFELFLSRNKILATIFPVLLLIGIGVIALAVAWLRKNRNSDTFKNSLTRKTATVTGYISFFAFLFIMFFVVPKSTTAIITGIKFLAIVPILTMCLWIGIDSSNKHETTTWGNKPKQKGLSFTEKFSLIFGCFVFISYLISTGVYNTPFYDITGKYSCAEEMAEYIETNFSADDVFITNSVPATSAVVACFDNSEYKVIDIVNENEAISYCKWFDRKWTDIELADYISKLKGLSETNEHVYMLMTPATTIDGLNEYLLSYRNSGVEVLYIAEDDHSDEIEQYILLKINLNRLEGNN